MTATAPITPSFGDVDTDRKLGIIRETYAMLNAESQAARAEAW